MSKYDGIMNKVPGGTKLVMEFREGQDAHIRILRDPWVTITKFENNPAPAVQYSWLVWDYDQQRVRLMRKSQNVFEQFVDIIKDWTDEMPMTCDIRVKTELRGDYLNFGLKASPQRGVMPPTSQMDIPDLSMYQRGSKTIEQIQSGEVPPILDKDGNSVAPGGLLGGAQEVAALPGEGAGPAASSDTVITDLDTSQEIDLDKIPF